MGFATKVAHRLSDPVFYLKHSRNLLRILRQFRDSPKEISQDDVKSVAKALVFVAHPDDETFCSGLISALKANGSEVTVICMTRGEGGPTGGAKREDLGRIREKEMKAACDALEVDRLVFLDHVDPLGGAYRVFAPEVSVDQLADEIRPYFLEVDLVISHGSSGEYWHAAHLLAHSAVRKVLGGDGTEATAWITFLARDEDHLLPHLINEDDEAALRFDASGFHAKRLAALDSHATQRSLFRRFAGGETDDFVQSTSVESYCLQAGNIDAITDLGND
ncbi:MAG: PIG-L family deacetylase [Verrucomicrobiales bacterium]|nr:PIG-L family deacetylase [Verrucomicrobiales bacterium]